MIDARPRNGNRHRVGLIIPSVNAVIEPDYAAAAPQSLTFHSTRVMLGETTPEGLRAMNAGVAAAAELIASVTPEVVAYACTSGTFIDGADGLTRQVAMIEKVVACDVVATSRCMVDAIRYLGLTRIALATPYLDVINHAEKAFLENNGLTVTAVKGLGLSGKAIREVDPEDIAKLVRDADTLDSQAIFVSCTDFRAMEIVGLLEAERHKPVLTSNQVTLWGLLRALGRTPSVPGYGMLLA
jgi:maleate cis-trans isomerase